MRSILLHIADDRCMDARLQAALDMARICDGHVTCLQSLPVESVVTGDAYGDLAVNLIPALREQAQALRDRLEPRLHNEDARWDWVMRDGPARYAMPEFAVLSDVIVMGACDELGGASHYSDLAADIVVHTRTPVLLVPDHCHGIDVTRPIAIAWNGSDEACRALRAAMPLVRRAASVHLLTVAEDGHVRATDLPPVNGATYLSNHGIACEIVELPVQSGGVASTLFHAAKARGAGCLVTGAYGHTRLRELLLGGVTRSMMSNPELPLFLAH